jgi:mycofactocin biosynthetic radical S-adenosylmethionine protein MftC
VSRVAALKRRALAAAVPLSVHFELTYTCPWRCELCYNPRRHDIHPLTVEEWKPVLDDLRRLGTLFVTLTGGEPLAYPGFLQLARAVRQRAMALRIFTNGDLVDSDMAAEIAALYPLSVELSLHGAGAATHDRTTGRDGSFERLMAAVERLQRVGVNLVLKAPVTRLNEGEVERMAALAEGLGLPLRFDPAIAPRDDGDQGPLAFAASCGGIRRTFQLLAKHGGLPAASRVEGGFNCGLGRSTLAIDPEGKVFPCIQWRSSSLGNVRETGLAELWRTSPVRRRAAEVASEANQRMLQEGGAVAGYPFCPAVAELRHHDPYAVGDDVRRQAELAQALQRPA